MWQTVILSAIFLITSFIFLAIKLLIVKNGTFPKTHVSQNKALRDKGITCVQTQDFEERTQRGLYATSGKDNIKQWLNISYEKTDCFGYGMHRSRLKYWRAERMYRHKDNNCRAV